MNDLLEWTAEEKTDLIGSKCWIEIRGTVETTNGSQTPILSETESDGLNHNILILDLAITSSGIGTKEMGLHPVAFDKNCQKGQYKQVQIRKEENSITIDVNMVLS